MSDDVFVPDDEEWKSGAEDFAALTRTSTVTERLSTVFHLLCDPRRRYLLYYLVMVDGDVVEIPAAVNAVSNFEAADTETDDTSPKAEIRIALHHNHLPRLSNAGILDYDERQGTIRFTGNPALEEWVEHARQSELV